MGRIARIGVRFDFTTSLLYLLVFPVRELQEEEKPGEQEQRVGFFVSNVRGNWGYIGFPRRRSGNPTRGGTVTA